MLDAPTRSATLRTWVEKIRTLSPAEAACDHVNAALASAVTRTVERLERAALLGVADRVRVRMWLLERDPEHAAVFVLSEQDSGFDVVVLVPRRDVPSLCLECAAAVDRRALS